MLADIFVYSFGLGFPTTKLICQYFEVESNLNPHFSGRAYCYAAKSLPSSQEDCRRVGARIQRVATPKLALFLFRHDKVGTPKDLETFFATLGSLLPKEPRAILAACTPLRNGGIAGGRLAVLQVLNYIYIFFWFYIISHLPKTLERYSKFVTRPSNIKMLPS